MKFHDDMSYTNKTLADRGLVKIVPFQIRLDRFFTEEEKSESRAFADRYGLNSEEWKARCDEIQQKIANENLALMDFLEKHYTFGQYKEPYHYGDKKDYTFWFWCNDLYNTTNRRLSGRDYSDIHLSLEKENIEENERIFAEVKKLLEDYPAKNIQAIFQYSQVENADVIKEEAERIFKACEGKFINYLYSTGKLQRYEDGYIFKKKNAKKYGYRVTPMEICVNVIV